MSGGASPKKQVNIQSGDSASIDAFARWRVSNPVTIFDSKNIFDDPDLASSVENQPLFWDNAETSGSGTSTSYDVNGAKQVILVGNTTAGTRVRQTKQRFNYQSGKSLLILMSFNMNGGATGITKRAGYFHEPNGLYFELDGDTAYMVRRTSTSGSPVNNRVAQSSWNLDPMDGTGPCGVTLDFSKTQILIIDFEWLGVGRVRMGFVVDGVICYAHEFLNANNLSVVYMSEPNHPVRYEISNDGTGAADSLDTICSTVISEGGSEELGVLRYTSTTTLVDVNVAGTIYALVGLRLKSNYLDTSISLIAASLIETAGSKDLEWLLLYKPTVAGTFTYTDLPNSAIQAAYGATANTVTGGTEVAGGFFNSSNGGTSGAVNASLVNALRLGSTISGTPDTFVLCARPLNAVTNCDVYGALTWREFT